MCRVELNVRFESDVSCPARTAAKQRGILPFLLDYDDRSVHTALKYVCGDGVGSRGGPRETEVCDGTAELTRG